MDILMQFFSSYKQTSRRSIRVQKIFAGTMVALTLTAGGSSFFQMPTAHGDNTDIAITKTVDSSTPNTGDTVHYTITVSAIGAGTSTGVVANDVLPSGVTFVSSFTSTGSYDSGSGNWTIGDMSSGSSQILVITATVNAGAAGETITNTATASDQNTTSVSSSVGINVTGTPTPPPAGIAVTKTVDNPTPHEGDTVHYTITVSAMGPATSTGVVATDTLPAGLTFVSATPSTGSYSSSTGTWTIGDMASSTSQVLVIAATVNSGTASTTITNTATIGESLPSVDPNLANNSSSVSIAVQSNGSGGGTLATTTADLAVTKTVDNPTPNVGDVIHYTITLSDLGPATSTGVVATDTLPSGLTFVSAAPSTGSYASSTGTWTIGDMASSTSQVLVIAATVNSGTAGQTIVNTVNASESAPSTDPNLANNSSSVAITVQGGGGGGGTMATTTADVAVTKTVDNPAPSEGNTIHYTLTVSALGPATSTGVVATDTLPSGLTFVSATPSTGSYASSTGTWTIGDMPSSTSQVLIIAASVNSGTASTTITNTATVAESASSTDPNLANNSSSVAINVQPNTGGGGTVTADIAITKTVDNATPATGNTVHYTLTVTDLGPDMANIVNASDSLPSGLDFVSASTSVGTYNLSSGVWTIGALASSTSATMVITAIVDPSMAGQAITNTATVSELSSIVDPNPGNNSSSVSINVQPSSGGGGTTATTTAALDVTKTVDNTTPNAGDTVNYTITVSAMGPATSTGVVATDTLPTGLTFVNATATVGAYASSTGTWTIGDMASGTVAVLTIAATVNAGTNGQTITNTASVGESASSTNPNSANNASAVPITVQTPEGGTGTGGGSSGGGGPGGVPPGGSIVLVGGSGAAYSISINAGATSTATTSVELFLYGTNAAGMEISNTSDFASSTWVPYATQAPWVLTPDAGEKTVYARFRGENGVTLATVSASIDLTAATPGAVLGASTSCGVYLEDYIHPTRQDLNDPTEVEKLQIFLNEDLGLNLPITGIYNAATIQAVDQFQVKYNKEVLAPWVPLGLQSASTPTGYVYKTTRWWINNLACNSLDLPMPNLP